MLQRIRSRLTFSAGLLAAAIALAAGPALAHDHGRGHGPKHWKRGYYYAPAPVVVYQQPRPVYVAPPPPPPVYYAPPPVVYAPPQPSVNVVIPLRF